MPLSGIPLRTVLAATAAGAIVGTTYALSPWTVWFAIAIAGVMVSAGRGLPKRERRWVLGVMAVAIILRVLAIVALFLLRDPRHQYFASFFFDGDGGALKLRSMWIASFWSGGRVDRFESSGSFDRGYGWTSYLNVLGYLQYLLGAAPYGIHLLNVALFLAGGVIIHRFVRLAYGRLAALVGLVFLLFSPTLFLWSMAALKESFQFFLMAATLIAALHALQQRSWWKRLVAAAASVLALTALNTVRQGVLELAAAAIGLGAPGAVVVRRRYVLIACSVAFVVGSGYLLHRDDVQTLVIAQLQRAASLHIGNVHTEGHAYKTLDAYFYTQDYGAVSPITLTGPEALRFVLRSLLSFVFVPLPWTPRSASELVFLPAQICWYGIFFLVLAGFMPGLRRHALLTLTITAYGLAGAFIVSLNNGNAGTLVRLRDMVTPFLVWLAAMGAVSSFVRVTAGKVRHPERIDRRAPAFSVVIGSSVALQWLRPLTAESRVYRAMHEFFTRPTRHIDAGAPQDEERLALAHLDTIMQRSRIFTVPAAWLARFLAAWPEAETGGFVMRHFDRLSTSQRVRLIGWAIAVAVVIEALFGRAGSAGALPFSFGAQLTFLALACLFMIASEGVTAAWNHHHRWNPNS